MPTFRSVGYYFDKKPSYLHLQIILSRHTVPKMTEHEFDHQYWKNLLQELSENSESIDATAIQIFKDPNHRKVMSVWFLLLIRETNEKSIMKYVLLGGRIAEANRKQYKELYILIRKLLIWSFYSLSRHSLSKLIQARIRRLLSTWQISNLFGWSWIDAMMKAFDGTCPQILGTTDLYLEVCRSSVEEEGDNVNNGKIAVMQLIESIKESNEDDNKIAANDISTTMTPTLYKFLFASSNGLMTSCGNSTYNGSDSFDLSLHSLKSESPNDSSSDHSGCGNSNWQLNRRNSHISESDQESVENNSDHDIKTQVYNQPEQSYNNNNKADSKSTGTSDHVTLHLKALPYFSMMKTIMPLPSTTNSTDCAVITEILTIKPNAIYGVRSNAPHTKPNLGRFSNVTGIGISKRPGKTPLKSKSKGKDMKTIIEAYAMQPPISNCDNSPKKIVTTSDCSKRSGKNMEMLKKYFRQTKKKK